MTSEWGNRRVWLPCCFVAVGGLVVWRMAVGYGIRPYRLFFGVPPFDGQLWQRSFYDHIIRNRHDYNEVCKYIYENPMRWRFDKLYREGLVKLE